MDVLKTLVSFWGLVSLIVFLSIPLSKLEKRKQKKRDVERFNEAKKCLTKQSEGESTLLSESTA